MGIKWGAGVGFARSKDGDYCVSPEKTMVNGDPSEDTSGVPWLKSRLTERSISQCMWKVELR